MMQKGHYLSIILFALTLLYACKVPENAINSETVPDNYSITDVTDSLEYFVYNEIGKTLHIYQLEDYSDSLKRSFVFILFNDTLEDVIFYQIEEGKTCFKSSALFTNHSNIKFSSSCERVHKGLNMWKNFSLLNRDVTDHKKGHTFQEITGKYHHRVQEYFTDSYQKFLSDTMNSWNPKNYSIAFSESDNGKEIRDFLYHAIAYHLAFPEQMSDWPAPVRKNMELMGEHLGKSYEELRKLHEYWLGKNHMVNAVLFSILMYLDKKDYNEYRFAQSHCANNPQLRWYHSSK